MNSKNITVSICCITYNHGHYIRECIEGFLMQKTNFDFEIVIHDDCSTDETKAIIEEYVAGYPDKIFPLFQTENQYSKGIRAMNPRFNYPRARGKYIALCEGDDYWTDPLKLQKQVDFLEANPEFNLCGHHAIKKNEFTKAFSKKDSFAKSEYDFEIISTKHIPLRTASIVFRNNIEIPDWFFKVYGGDKAIMFLNAQKGKLKILDFVGSVYRIHSGGVEQNYKKDKFALPERNIKEHFVYLCVLKEKRHKQIMSKKIIKNHLYILIWSVLKIYPLKFINTTYSLFLFAVVRRIHIK